VLSRPTRWSRSGRPDGTPTQHRDRRRPRRSCSHDQTVHGFDDLHRRHFPAKFSALRLSVHDRHGPFLPTVGKKALNYANLIRLRRTRRRPVPPRPPPARHRRPGLRTPTRQPARTALPHHGRALRTLPRNRAPGRAAQQRSRPPRPPPRAQNHPPRAAPRLTLPRPLQRHGQSPARPRPRRHRRPPHPRIDRQHTSQHRLATSGPRRTPAYPRHRHRDSRPGSTSQPQLRRRGTPRRRPPARGRAVHQRADPALRHRTQHDTPSHRVRTMVLTCR
jgi:hypothetical protein